MAGVRASHGCARGTPVRTDDPPPHTINARNRAGDDRIAFAWPRATVTTPNSALAPRIGAVLVIASACFGIWAIYALGRQWSIQARLRTDHRLVTRGPYRWVRHPVYACFFGRLVATGLVFSTAPGLAIGVLFYATGTAIRIRSEDALLREQFGKEFDDYSRRTPALIPFRVFW